jgi:hypothetical protein
MAVAVPRCWDGLRSADWYRHRAEREEWYKVELLDGVLVLTLRTRRVRSVIDRLAATVADALPPGHVVVTSNDRASTSREDDDGALRRQGVVHETAASGLRADLEAQLQHAGRRELAVLLGAGWQPTPGGPLWWTDVCVVPWAALVDPVDRSGLWTSSPPPSLIVEVTEPATSELDRGERAAAYAAGGCAWLVVVDPADPQLRRRSSTLELYDLRDGRMRCVARGTDRLTLDDPWPLRLDLSALSEFAASAIDAWDEGER